MPNTQSSRIYGICFMVVATVGIAVLGYQVLSPFLAAIAWAVVLAVAFQAYWVKLHNKLHPRRNLAAGLLTAAIGLLVLLPAGLLIGVLANQAHDAVTALTAKYYEANVHSFSDLVKLPGMAHFLDGLKDRAGISPETFQRVAGAVLTRAKELAPGLSAQLALSIAGALGTYFMTLFLLFFFFRDGRLMARAALELVPVGPQGRMALGRSLRTMLQAIFRGSLLCALAQGATGAVGWWIAGLPLPLLAGAAMAVLSLLPVGGTAIVWLPGALWAWASGHRGGAIFLLVWSMVVVAFLADNVLRPLLMRGSQELSPLVVILGVFGGLAAFGVLGLFIGPLSLVLGIAILDALRAQAMGLDPEVAVEETGAAPLAKP